MLPDGNGGAIDVEPAALGKRKEIRVAPVLFQTTSLAPNGHDQQGGKDKNGYE
jgi:hypothetical protein